MGDTLESFLHSINKDVRSEFQSIHSQKQKEVESSPRFNAVIGNEAGDADSILSAIGLAYVLQLEQKYFTDTEIHGTPMSVSNTDLPLGEDFHGKVIHQYSFPVISIPRNDMKLRRDVTLLLALCRISSLHEFIYIDDVLTEDKEHMSLSLSPLFKQDEGENQTYFDLLQLTLVDHNKIRSSLWHLHDRVGQIWDHHCDEGFHTQVNLRNIAFDSTSMTALVGSTCTLVTEELERVLRSCKGSTNFLDVDPALGLALLGVILIDTMNMSKIAGKGTERDQKAIDFLIHHTSWETLVTRVIHLPLKSYYERIFPLHAESGSCYTQPSMTNRVRPNRAELYEILRDCKFDQTFWSELSTEDALRIDYKTFGSSRESFTFGLSSILLPCAVLQEKENFLTTALQFMKGQRIIVLGILSLVVVNNVPIREICLLGPEKIVRSLTNYLLLSEDSSSLSICNRSDENLQTFVGDDSTFLMTTLLQGNSSASRKQIAPIIQYFISKILNGNESSN